MIRDPRPVINTDDTRWLEYSTPRYQSRGFDWRVDNSRFFAQYRD